jgi:hypothetical protein
MARTLRWTPPGHVCPITVIFEFSILNKGQ